MSGDVVNSKNWRDASVAAKHSSHTGQSPWQMTQMSTVLRLRNPDREEEKVSVFLCLLLTVKARFCRSLQTPFLHMLSSGFQDQLWAGRVILPRSAHLALKYMRMPTLHIVSTWRINTLRGTVLFCSEQKRAIQVSLRILWTAKE